MTTTTPKPTIADTIGANPRTIDRLWRHLQSSINHAYRHAPSGHPATALRDYADLSGPAHKLDRLLEEVRAEERQHRRMAPAGIVAPVSIAHAAKLTILHNVGRGASGRWTPQMQDWLVCRRTAVEAATIGALIRVGVFPEMRATGIQEWIDAWHALDYAAVMSQ